MRWICHLFLLLPALCLRAGAPVATFTENQGQWPEQVLYRLLLPNGALFVERGGFTYSLRAGGEAHAHGVAHEAHDHEPFRAHAFKVHFEGGMASTWSGGSRAPHYENFFLGNDPARWGTGCGVFAEVTLRDIWPGIDLHLDGRGGLKYEFLLDAGADPNAVRLRYEGHDGLFIRDGRLVVETTAGEVVEEAPFSFYADDAAHSRIGSAFKTEQDRVVFEFPEGIDPARPLVIDPTLSFASYSGSLANNFGFTATYDGTGHLYGAGIVFAQGYPTTLGVQDDTYNGLPGEPSVDVGVSKWTPDGSALIWSTYVGGVSSDAPHSMVVNDADELFIFGHTGSLNFPTTPGCSDATFNGGPPLEYTIGYGFSQPNGTDMFVTHLTADATALVGSTYIGGADNDGVNNDVILAHNYGDSFRGEIIVDGAGNPIVASVTSSIGLPVVNAAQPAFGGGTQDGFCFRMDPTLSTLSWASYLGGSGADAAYGVQIDQNGQVFVSGGTTSIDLPMYGSPFRSSSAGATDGFVLRYDPSGTALSSTYLGTEAYDQCYFVQLDTEDEVYVVGQTNGAYPVSPGRYVVPGSSQFIHKLTHDLDASVWSTVFGNGDSSQNLSPTAFLVSNCGQIYFSGWGGATNGAAGNVNSTTTGSSTTADAFQAVTDGNDLYIMVLEPDATGLNYATFFGGGESSEHVDGGTSRFDKNGTIYHAVCAGCQNNDDFPTTPGAWSNTNGSQGCNLGVLKFDLLATVAIIAIDGPSIVCAPTTVQFTNSSVGGDTYFWDFGDGGTSTEAAPQHTYEDPGEYTVTMRLSDSFSCALPDSTTLTIIVQQDPPIELDPVDPICPGDSIQVAVTTGVAWAWSPTLGVSDPAAPDPFLAPLVPTTYTIAVTGACGTTMTEVFVDIFEPDGTAGPDRLICAGEAIALDGSGGGTYVWEPGTPLSSTTAEDPLASPTDSTVYSVSITTPEGCVLRDTVIVAVDAGLPVPALEDTTVCEGGTARLIAPPGRQYLWENAVGVADPNRADVTVAPEAPGWYVVVVTNACGSIRDSAFVSIPIPTAAAEPDTIVCSGERVQLLASTGTTHTWSPTAGLDNPTIPTPMAVVTAPVTYTVVVTDELGCAANASVFLDIHPLRPVTAYWDAVIELGQTAQLLAVGDGTFSWKPTTTLSDTTSATPVAEPEQTTTYTVSMTDANGCVTTDEVTIIIPGSLFIPNTFTPNSDGYNDAFGAWGVDIVEIELEVYDRWGKMIWTTADLRGRWDGTYGGQDAPIDTYVWRVRAKEIAGEVIQRTGHVTLVR
ncbi:MAG: PKD domain-containing protein [Flavobacteriales bacterium]